MEGYEKLAKVPKSFGQIQSLGVYDHLGFSWLKPLKNNSLHWTLTFAKPPFLLLCKPLKIVFLLSRVDIKNSEFKIHEYLVSK